LEGTGCRFCSTEKIGRIRQPAAPGRLSGQIEPRRGGKIPAQAQVEAWVLGRAERVGVYGPFLQPGFKTVKEVCHFSIFQKHFEWYFE
jgi:hypothetical protein